MGFPVDMADERIVETGDAAGGTDTSYAFGIGIEGGGYGSAVIFEGQLSTADDVDWIRLPEISEIALHRVSAFDAEGNIVGGLTVRLHGSDGQALPDDPYLVGSGSERFYEGSSPYYLSVSGSAATDYFIGIERIGRLGFGTEHNDVTGMAGVPNRYYAYGGSDRIRGNTGNDTIFGGDGRDPLVGNDGDDSLFGDAGDDTLSGASGDDMLDGGLGDDLLLGFDDNDLMLGGTGADRLQGLSDDDQLRGGNGSDSLYGGDGNDFLVGGAGSDFLGGGAGSDAVSYADATRALTLDLVDQTANAGAAAGDVISSAETIRGTRLADSIAGNAHRNTLRGNDGNDHLAGREGADTLSGGTGDDTLMGGADGDLLAGGAGRDVFVFAADGAEDLVLDFDAADDVIRIEGGSDATVATADGNTVITFMETSVVLVGVTLGQADITFEFA